MRLLVATALLLRISSVLGQTCDEALSFESGSRPAAARDSFQAENLAFPLIPVGQCSGEVDGMPTSPARPGLWERFMFGVGPGGEPNKNFQANDLPIVDTYFDAEGRPVDVYETVTTTAAAVDIFYSDSNPSDICRPEGYQSTDGFFLYGSATVPHFAPGPTLKGCLGRQSAVRFENRATIGPISVHLHGAASVAAYDGWADDTTATGFAKNYFYPNNRAASSYVYSSEDLRARTHFFPYDTVTADHANAGLAGMYVVKECDSPLEQEYFPDDDHTIPFMLKDLVLDNQFNIFFDPLGPHEDDMFGDINFVNGVAWPKLPVDPLTYRLRLLGLAISRAWLIKFLAVSSQGQQAWVPFWIVQTDGGDLRDMIRTYSLHSDVAERYTLLLNFNTQSAAFPTLNNPEDSWVSVYAVNDLGDDSRAPIHFCKSHLLARFDILDVDASASFRGVDFELAAATQAPERLLANFLSNGGNTPSLGQPYKGLRNLLFEAEISRQLTRALDGEFDRRFQFGRAGGEWAINGCTWRQTDCRIIANPPRNGIELWKLESGGGWHHPVHIHLIDFLLLVREGGDSDIWEDNDPLNPGGEPGLLFRTLPGLSGIPNGLRPWEVDAPKDVINLGPSQNLFVLTLWGPNDGDFMWHCHNLVHEDNDMMTAIGVGRASAVDGQEVFTADGDRNDFVLMTLDQDDKFYTVSGPQIPVVEWESLEPNRVDGDFGSPYNPQIAKTGQIIKNLRAGTGDRARQVATDPTFENGALLSDYVCAEACKGYYVVYYPDTTTTNGALQLDFRPGFGNPDNPIRNNIWARPFNPMEQATNIDFVRTSPGYTAHPACTCETPSTLVPTASPTTFAPVAATISPTTSAPVPDTTNTPTDVPTLGPTTFAPVSATIVPTTAAPSLVATTDVPTLGPTTFAPVSATIVPTTAAPSLVATKFPTVAPVTVPAPIAVNCPKNPILINAGDDMSKALVEGTAWSYMSTEAISGELQGFSERWFRLHLSGPSGFQLPITGLLDSSTYDLTLGFAENYQGNCLVGKRVFSVKVNNELLVDHLDVFSEVGCNKVLLKTFTLKPVAGTLNVEFIGHVQNPLISLLRVEQVTCGVMAPTPAPHCQESPATLIDAGDDMSKTLVEGTTWSYMSTEPIAGDLHGFKERSFRLHMSGSSGFQLPITGLSDSSSYAVKLGFAENYRGNCRVGRRVFSVKINDELVVDHLDIFSEVGCNTALVESFSLKPVSGAFVITFVGHVENPLISLVSVEQIDCSGTSAT